MKSPCWQSPKISENRGLKSGMANFKIRNIRDISGRKTLEDQVRSAQKMDAIGRLAGGIAHDFNNLLTAVSGNVSLAMALLPQDDKALPLLGRIEQAAGRAKALSRQLLTFATGGQPLRKQIVVPGKLVNLVV